MPTVCLEREFLQSEARGEVSAHLQRGGGSCCRLNTVAYLHHSVETPWRNYLSSETLPHGQILAHYIEKFTPIHTHPNMKALVRILVLTLAASTALAEDCDDAHSGCGSWAESGECSKNEAFMKISCGESCGFCTPPPMLEKSDDPLLGDERVVMQISWSDTSKGEMSWGEIVLGFYPTIAPVTVAHILRLVRMGGYNPNEIFRVDKGFVAQLQGVDGGRRAPMNKALREIAIKTVPDEFNIEVRHKKGMLSMGKFEAPDTGTSSFSMLLGDAPFLDNKYTIFGRVVKGDAVLKRLEQVETVREGIFVKPKVRVEVVSAVVMYADGRGGLVLDDSERRKVEL